MAYRLTGWVNERRIVDHVGTADVAVGVVRADQWFGGLGPWARARAFVRVDEFWGPVVNPDEIYGWYTRGNECHAPTVGPSHMGWVPDRDVMWSNPTDRELGV